MELVRDKHDAIIHTVKVGYGTIKLSARNVRKTDTGVHARLAIDLNDDNLAFTVCNIERNEERTRLANSAHKFLGMSEEDADSIISKGELLFKLNNFCDRVWQKYLSIQTPEVIEGTTDISSVLYALKPHVIDGGGTIMYGKPGKGKSFTGIMMALAVNYGTNHYWDTTQGNTVFINLERPARTIPPRVGAIASALGLDSNSNLVVMNNRGQGLVDIHDALEEYIKNNNVKFVVLDSISRSGAGDMKEDRVATRTIDMLNDLGVSWVAIAHTPKYDDQVYYGSGMYEAGADVMLRHNSTIIDDSGSLAILLEVTKANDMPVPKPMGLHYSFDENGLSAIRFATKDEVSDLVNKEITLRDSIKEYLGETGKATATKLSVELSMERAEVTEAIRILFKAGEVIAVGLNNSETEYGLSHGKEKV